MTDLKIYNDLSTKWRTKIDNMAKYIRTTGRHVTLKKMESEEEKITESTNLDSDLFFILLTSSLGYDGWPYFNLISVPNRH